MRIVSINRVTITGNLTRDSELKVVSNGTPILNIGVAVNDRWRNPQTGNWEDRPNFIDCVMFGTRAEAISRYLTKGVKVAIEGKLRYSSWERDGQRRSKIEVIVDEIEFMSSRQSGQNAAPTSSYQQDPYQASAPAQSVPAQSVPVSTPPSGANFSTTDVPF